MSTARMAPVSRSTVYQVAAVPPGWFTPDLLKAGLGAIWIASLLLMIADITGARSHRQAMQYVGRDAAPSIVAAEHIRSALADMEGNAATELLSKEDAPSAYLRFELRRKEATDAIISAAQNITYGEAERQPILKLAVGLGNYTAAEQKARDLRSTGDKNWIDSYRAAAAIMDETLLPAAADLDNANREMLDKTYLNQRGISARSTLMLLASGLLVGGLLIAMQIFLAQRVRRFLNPMLICATIATFVFVVNSLNSFRAEDKELKIAKEDAFESIHSLWLARSLAYTAHSDTARYLFDPAQAALYQRNFNETADRIARLPAGEDRDALISRLTQGDKVQGFTGKLADELNNITFSGEREAAVETLSRFLAYRDSELRMRAPDKSGKRPGTGTDDANQAFQKFDESLGRTLDVNQQAFNAAVKSGFQEVSGFEIYAPIGATVIGLFAYLGLRPRIREYYL